MVKRGGGSPFGTAALDGAVLDSIGGGKSPSATGLPIGGGKPTATAPFELPFWEES